MESFLKKLGAKSGPYTRFPDADPQDLALADEQDEDPFSADFSGHLDLTVADDEIAKNSLSVQTDVASPEIIPYEGGNDITQIHFEVTSADIIQDQRANYVLYTILIASHPHGVEKVPTQVEKRYSDFSSLNDQLRKKYPHLMADISFPKKVLIGNFSSETIAKRSRAFEQYLFHVFSVPELRFSEEFADFFFQTDVKTASVLFCEEKYSQSIPLFEKCLPISEKILGGCHHKVFFILCCLVVSYSSLENLVSAYEYAELALKCSEENLGSNLCVSLVKISVRLCWSLGKDKQDLEERLLQYKSRRIDVDRIPDLKDVIKQDYIFNI